MSPRESFQHMDEFVESTRAALFVRPVDRLLMIRPDKTMALNESATAILSALYARESGPAAEVLTELSTKLGVDFGRLTNDTEQLLRAVGSILREDFSPRPGLRFGSYEPNQVAYPTLAEIALTYGCQNRCRFCYASSPSRSREERPMTTSEVKLVMGRIFNEGHVPSLSFTGGESTLRPDLGELIEHGKEVGFRVNLITNGVRAADPEYARHLVDRGLDSAQVSLEAVDPALHDSIVGKPGAHEATLAGIENLQELGIHVHTNTTLCSENLDYASDLVRFAAQKLKTKTLSMNMVIPTGDALDRRSIGVTYTQVAERLPALVEDAKELGAKLVWYSPIPYCIFNPVTHGLGAKSCACVGGILSVGPTGQVLPCSSFETGLGSLLRAPFERIYRSRRARYWRNKKFVPSICHDCHDVDVCAGACPLYWDAAGSFSELPIPGADDPKTHGRWQRARRRSKSYGVLPSSEVS